MVQAEACQVSNNISVNKTNPRLVEVFRDLFRSECYSFIHDVLLLSLRIILIITSNNTKDY